MKWTVSRVLILFQERQGSPSLPTASSRGNNVDILKTVDHPTSKGALKRNRDEGKALLCHEYLMWGADVGHWWLLQIDHLVPSFQNTSPLDIFLMFNLVSNLFSLIPASWNRTQVFKVFNVLYFTPNYWILPIKARYRINYFVYYLVIWI